MPAYHQPLRQRCKFNLSVNTSMDDRDWGRSQGKTFKRAYYPESLFSNAGTAPGSPRSSSPDPGPHRNVLKSFYHFIPYVSFAFADGHYDPLLVQRPPSGSRSPGPDSPSLDIPFTHIIRILHPSASSDLDIPLEPGMAWPIYNEERGVAVLNIVIPETYAHAPSVEYCRGESMATEVDRKITLLTQNQLILARDFLCLALPFYRADHWHRALTPSTDDVHVLITAPWPERQSDPCSASEVSLLTPTSDSPFWVAEAARRATSVAADVVSIAASYLAMCSQREACRVMKDVNADLVMNERYGTKNAFLWKDRVGPDGCAVLDRIARLG